MDCSPEKMPAIACPNEEPARIAIATQNILREEAHLCDVIDPLGGSYYVESLTDAMEAEIRKVLDIVDAAGGMYKAVESGLVQRMIGASALEHQQKIEAGAEKLVGVNCYADGSAAPEPESYRPDRAAIEAHVQAFRAFKQGRDQHSVQRALDALARAANGDENVYARIVEAAETGVTHGEIVACLRRELGFGQPLMVA